MTDKFNKEDIEFQITQYLDGDLPPRSAKRLEQLLRSDESLRDLLDQYHRLDEHLERMGSREGGEIDYDLQRAQIMGALERKTLLEGVRRRRWAVRPVFASLAAAAVLIAVASAGVLLFRGGSQSLPVREIAIATLVLPHTPAPENAQLVVEPRTLEWDEIRMVSADQVDRTDGIPSGTVLVRISREPAYRDSVYPLLME